MQKARLVRVLKARGHIVGFLGDGINDSPALRESDVGISVDTAADITKDTADVILLEKDLTVICSGVIRGRITYANTIKYIKMAVSSNFGNMFSMLVAAAWLPFDPMIPAQIVSLNLLYDISQIAIPWDNVDADFLMTPKSWHTSSILSCMVFIGPISSVFDVTTFILMYYYFGCDEDTAAKSALFRTGWFVESLLTQTLIVHMIRTDKLPLFQSNASPAVIALTSAVMAVGVGLCFFTPAQSYLGFAFLPGIYFAYLAATIASYWMLTQVAKKVYICIFGYWM